MENCYGILHAIYILHVAEHLRRFHITNYVFKLFLFPDDIEITVNGCVNPSCGVDGVDHVTETNPVQDGDKENYATP